MSAAPLTLAGPAATEMTRHRQRIAAVQPAVDTWNQFVGPAFVRSSTGFLRMQRDRQVARDQAILASHIRNIASPVAGYMADRVAPPCRPRTVDGVPPRTILNLANISLENQRLSQRLNDVRPAVNTQWRRMRSAPGWHSSKTAGSSPAVGNGAAAAPATTRPSTTPANSSGFSAAMALASMRPFSAVTGMGSSPGPSRGGGGAAAPHPP
eukprot:RCo022280